MRNWQRENISPKQLITIRQRGGLTGGVNDQDQGVDMGEDLIVSAPLPDGWGMTVGSEFGTPFDTGGVNDTLAKLFAIGGISQKAGIRMKKMYMNPEPTEISFDMEFYAWYDAKSEVLIPAVTLLAMALGRTLTYDELKGKMKGFYMKVAGGVNTALSYTGVESSVDEEVSLNSENETVVSVEEGADKLLSLIGLIQGPPSSEIRFGEAMVLPECYVTSVAAKFSNVLDPDGIPMSCTCSVTATLVQAPVADDITEYFDFRENR